MCRTLVSFCRLSSAKFSGIRADSSASLVQEAHVEFVKRTHECDKWYHKFVDQEIALKEEQSKAHPDPRKIKAIHSML